ncbi:MAG: hypothetical protein ACTSR8_03590 [Promethearchaeota archaeon]
MDAFTYLLGILFGLLAGVIFGTGTIMQKLAINRLPKDSELMRSLTKNKLWLTGFLFQFILGSIFMIFAQLIIGPALVPGLTATGLIVLAIGSIKIIGEDLKLSEIVGILLMVLGIFILCFSELSIEITSINFMELGFLFRVYLFSGILFLSVGVLYFIQLKTIKEGFKGISLALASGILYSIQNLWVSIMILIASNFFLGIITVGETIVFLSGILFTIILNIYGVTTMQRAFQTGQASNLAPIQTVPIQLTPIIIYFFVFFLMPSSFISIIFMISGIFLILTSSFLLGKRQGQLEEIQ